MSELDRYDVEAMIRDKEYELRGFIDLNVSNLRDDLHGSLADLRGDLRLLRERIEQLEAQS